MAKEYLEVFLDSSEDQYQSGKYPIMALSAQNLQTKKVRFTSLGEANDGTNTIPEYNIQRWKRTKEGAQQNTKKTSPGDDYIATLNQAQTIEWETIKTKRSTQKQLLVNVKKGAGTNALEDSSPFERTIAARSENHLISKEERAVEKILASIKTQTQEIDITALITAASTPEERREIIADSFSDVADTVMEFVDEYKYNSNAVALYNPRIGKAFAKLQGQGYQQGTNTFGDDFKSGFNYAGLDFFPEDVLKSVGKLGTAGDDTDKITLGFVMASDSYADSGMTQGFIEVNEQLIRNDVIGHIYDDLSIIIDPKRQYSIVASIASLKAAGLLGQTFKVQAKVND